MKRRRVWLILLLMTSLIVAACGPTTTENLSPLSTPAEGQAAVPSSAQEILHSIELDLAEQLDLDADKIQVVSVEAVEWPDASMGCPKPGMAYAQVLTAGYRIELQVEGQAYVYHTSSDSFVWCDESRPVEQPAKELRLEPKASALANQAQLDLSQILGLPVDEITVLSVEAVEWPDSSLGCPQPGMHYLQVVTPGYQILLQAQGKTYTYHADRQRAIYCGEMEAKAGSQNAALNAAMSDLAQKLNIPLNEITASKVESVQWPDASLGCPQPGMMYAQVVTPGYRIVLSAQGQEYEYHADLSRAIMCGQ